LIESAELGIAKALAHNVAIKRLKTLDAMRN